MSFEFKKAGAIRQGQKLIEQQKDMRDEVVTIL